MSGPTGATGWAGPSRDATAGLADPRVRQYSPGTGRFTQPDAVLPNAEGTQGWNPYWYANDNPETLTDPTGTSAGPIVVCPICTPVSLTAIYTFEAMQLSLAALAPIEAGNNQTTGRWTRAAVYGVAALLICISSAFCHDGLSAIDGVLDPVMEGIKEGIDLARQTIGAVLEAIRSLVAAWIVTIPMVITVVQHIQVPTPNYCRVTLAPFDWRLTPKRRNHIEVEHGPNSAKPNKSIYTQTAWDMIDVLIDVTLYGAEYAEPTRLDRCAFHVPHVGLVTGAEQNTTKAALKPATFGNNVIYQIVPYLNPQEPLYTGDIVTSYPANAPPRT